MSGIWIGVNGAIDQVASKPFFLCREERIY